MSLLEERGFRYVVAAKLKSMGKKQVQHLLSKDKNNDWVEEWHPESHPHRRMIVSYSQERARRDAKQREKVINQLIKKSRQGKINLKTLLGNQGNRKFLRVVGNSQVEINEAAISEAAK